MMGDELPLFQRDFIRDYVQPLVNLNKRNQKKKDKNDVKEKTKSIKRQFGFVNGLLFFCVDSRTLCMCVP
jgi:hypothetical protein